MQLDILFEIDNKNKIENRLIFISRAQDALSHAFLESREGGGAIIREEEDAL